MRTRTLSLLLVLLLLTGCGTAVPEEPNTSLPQPDHSTTEEYQPPAEQNPATPDTAENGVQPDHSKTPAETAQQQLEKMTLEQKLYQMMIVTPEALTGVTTATQAGATTEAAIRTYPVGGVIYFAQNLIDADQTATLLANTQSFSEIPLFLAVDEEGGTVSRVGANPAMGATKFPPMGELEGGADAAYQVGLTIGTELMNLGFNLDFAPVADVNSNPNNSVIGNRAFSSDPQTAAELVAAAVRGFRESGICCTLKHFPGHGDTATDSHAGYAQTTKTLQELKNAEFLPFQSGIDAGATMVMVGHISAPNAAGDTTPASLSKTIVTDWLRGELGFSGLVVTDAMNMGEITTEYSAGEAAVLAVEAGVDLLLMPSDFKAAYRDLREALDSGRVTQERIDESVLRILTAKVEVGLLQ